MPDWVVKEGDTAPVFTDTLSLEGGVDDLFDGATLELVLRSFTATEPLTLTGTAEFVSEAAGTVKYTPVTADTEGRAGQYMAGWRVTLSDGGKMTFPTVGYLTVTIEPNLLTESPAQLVSLPDAKTHLRISSGDRTQDARLTQAIRALRPVVENITGPIIPAEYEEWHTGGQGFINVRRRPSTTYGTTPILELLTATEYIGSTAHTLTIIDSPSDGSTYSCMIDRLGTISRITGGGGTGTFAHRVLITYRAGQDTIPDNVTEGALELLRINYQPTRAAGAGRRTVADEQDDAAPLGFYVPRRVRELLAPNRRAPAVA